MHRATLIVRVIQLDDDSLPRPCMQPFEQLLFQFGLASSFEAFSASGCVHAEQYR